MIEELLAEAKDKMGHAVDHVGTEFATVRTGRANPQILNRVHVEYYGTPTPLQQLATFSVPEPRLLVISPFDKGSMHAIEKALQEGDLGLMPSNDGTVIRLAFPPLTEERRRDLIKVVKGMAEEGRVAIRNIRRHVKSDMEALHGEISDDDIHRAEKDLQDLTDGYVAQVDDLLQRKEAELLEV
ncbi:MAG: ribosome recycling factor [Acidimicrobiia bacterium]|nr:ribosome recycling factor [Acidimicrobiia bacterium]MDH4306451.1 ribosome recycling factor [Acidimicrobiia bacterium]MDH5294780.1 ribosome recycling factor [Acidimicrobiia bacterium]